MSFSCSILVGTFGHTRWKHLAQQHAVPSAHAQGAHEVLWRHEANGTLAGVRNRLAEEASGDWLAFCDGDDRLGDGYLEAMGDVYEGIARAPLPYGGTYNPTLPLLLVPAVQWVRDGRCEGDAKIPNGGDQPGAEERMIDVNICSIGTVYPREFFLSLGGFGEEPVYEDWALALRAMIAGARLVTVPRAVYCAAVNPGGRNTPDAAAHETYWAIRRELEPAWRAAVKPKEGVF